MWIVRLGIFFIISFCLWSELARGQVAEVFTYSGAVVKKDGSASTDVVGVRLQVLSEDGNCILYDESNTGIDLSASSGNFAIQVGSNVGSSKRTAGSDPGLSMANIFSSKVNAQILAPSASSGCPAGYTVSAYGKLKLRVTLTGPDWVPDVLSPDETITSVPFAMQANSIQGFGPGDLLLVKSSGSVSLSQSNLENIFSSTNYPILTALLGGTSSLYARAGANGTVTLPSLSSPASLATGQVWFDSGAGTIKYYDGTNTQSVVTSGGGGGITSLNGMVQSTQTFSNDTNVTVNSAGGIHTLGWTGTLALNRGGTGSNMTATPGGVIYSTNTNMAVTATGTSGMVLTSNGAAAPSWQNIDDNSKVPIAGGTMTGLLTLSGDPSANLHAATKQFVLSELSLAGSNYILKNGTVAFTGDQSMGSHKLTNVSDPVGLQDAATKNYVETRLSSIDLTSQVTGVLPVSNGGTGSSAVTGVGLANNNILQNTSGGAIAGNSVLVSNGTGTGVTALATPAAGILTSSGSVPIWSSVSSDTFTQYALLAGRGGGQTLNGGTAAGNSLIIDSTSNATKGYVLLAPSGGNVGIGVAGPTAALDVNGMVKMTGFKMPTGANLAYVLTSDAVGVGTWQPAGGGLSGSTTATATTLGVSASGSANGHVAIGYQSGSGYTGTNSTLVGYQAGGAGGGGGNNVIIGSSAQGATAISGASNTIIGTSSSVSPGSVARAVALGSSATVTGTGGVAIGSGASAPANTVVIGTNPSGTFVERMRINTSGYVGIGTTAPSDMLHMATTTAGATIGTKLTIPNLSTGQATTTYELNGANEYWQIYADGNNYTGGNPMQSGFGIVYYSSGSGYKNALFAFPSGNISLGIDGNVGIGTTAPAYKLDSAGDVNISGSYSLRFAGTAVCTSAGCTSSSDRRLKENVEELKAEESLHKILRLRGVEYDYKDKARFGKSHQVGVIAQEVEEVFPEVVRTDPESNLKSVAYDHLVAPLIEAVKSLYGHVENLEKNSEKQQQRLDLIEERQNQLEKQLLRQQSEIEILKKENSMLKSKLSE